MHRKEIPLTELDAPLMSTGTHIEDEDLFTQMLISKYGNISDAVEDFDQIHVNDFTNILKVIVHGIH